MCCCFKLKDEHAGRSTWLVWVVSMYFHLGQICAAWLTGSLGDFGVYGERCKVAKIHHVASHAVGSRSNRICCHLGFIKEISISACKVFGRWNIHRVAVQWLTIICDPFKWDAAFEGNCDVCQFWWCHCRGLQPPLKTPLRHRLHVDRSETSIRTLMLNENFFENEAKPELGVF